MYCSVLGEASRNIGTCGMLCTVLHVEPVFSNIFIGFGVVIMVDNVMHALYHLSPNNQTPDYELDFLENIFPRELSRIDK